jgi:hypothetical protein
MSEWYAEKKFIEIKKEYPQVGLSNNEPGQLCEWKFLIWFLVCFSNRLCKFLDTAFWRVGPFSLQGFGALFLPLALIATGL